MKVVQVCTVSISARHLLLPQCEYLRSKGHEITFVFSPDPSTARDLRSKGFGVEEVPIPREIGPGDFRATQLLARFFRRVKPDVVHTHTSKAGVVGRVAARLAGVPHLIHTIHGFPFIAGQNPVKYYTYLAIEKFAGSLTDVLLSQSREDVATAVRYGITTRQGPPVHIGNGIDVTRFSKRRFDDTRKAQIRRELGVGDEPVITTIGRLVLEKGYGELCHALHKCAGHRFIALFIGPDEGARAGVEAMLTTYGLSGRVRLLGYRSDIDELLAVTDVYVLASYREGLPRSVIEAQAMGIPAVVTDIRGCREAVAAGETGLLVPPRDAGALARALASLLGSPDLRKSMGERAERFAREEFDEMRVFEKIEEVYDALGHPERSD